MGPALEKFALRHYSGDEFFFSTTGEDDSGFSGAIVHGVGGQGGVAADHGLERRGARHLRPGLTPSALTVGRCRTASTTACTLLW